MVKIERPLVKKLFHSKTVQGCLAGVLSGMLLDLAIFVPIVWAQWVAFIAIAPVLWAVVRIESYHLRYVVGLVFFGAWILPATYWYYSFMPVWLAFLASVGFVTLIANVFQLPNLLRAKKPGLVLSIIILSWALLTYARMNLPVMQDWWIPHLGYAVWQSAGVMQIARWAGEYGVEFVVLACNAGLAYLILKNKKKLAVAGALIVVGLSMLANYAVLSHQPANGVPHIVSLQALQVNGVDQDVTAKDIILLKSVTANAIKQFKDSSKPTLVVWPENALSPTDEPDLRDFAAKNNIYLVYNALYPNGKANPFKVVVLLGQDGYKLLTNYKQHAAPGEYITEDTRFTKAKIDGLVVSADVCYDLHYPDSSQRISGSDLVAVPIDDASFAPLQRVFHSADVVFRAIENNTNIVTSSTNGPTFFVNKNGVIDAGSLSYGVDGVLSR
jgi:apolipoprotein N-acyltransferase